jgi:hypothetical protein
MKRRLMIIALMVLAVGAVDAAVTAAGPVFQTGPEVAGIVVEPSKIEAGMFYNGATVGVSALVPEDLEITVSLVGQDEPVSLNRKGKALGLIWMNVGEVEIDGAPDLYLLNTTDGLEATAPILETAGVGYSALRDRTTLAGTGGDDDLYFNEFVGLKESDGLYALEEASVVREPAGNGRVRVSTDLQLAPKTPPGHYRLLIHGFGEEGGRLLGEIEFEVEQVGLAASIRTLAMDRGLLYGILAVVVAISVGLLIGVLFGLGSKGAH